MSYFKKRRTLGDDLPSPCDSDPESDECRELAAKPGTNDPSAPAAISTFFTDVVDKLTALATGTPTPATAGKPASSGLPIVPLALGAVGLYFLFGRKKR